MACIAQSILDKNALNPDVLKPIIETTFNNIIHHKACEIQTGPAIRQDYKLQNKHLKVLKSQEMWTRMYKLISASINQTYNKDENSK